MLFALVMLESLWLGLVGLVAAAVVTAGPYYYLGHDRHRLLGADRTSAAARWRAWRYLTHSCTSDIFPENALVIAAAALHGDPAGGNLSWPWQAGAVEPGNRSGLV